MKRRGFIVAIGGLGAGAAAYAATRTALVRAPGTAPAYDGTIEDLMREHAVLERVMLIYEEAMRRLETRADLDPDVLARAAGIVRGYIEDHHERDEERHVFPRLEQTGAELALLATLREQHAAGRRITDAILARATPSGLREPAPLVHAIRTFVRMYRPHAARENTVLFPSLRKALSQAEHERLRDTLEREELAAFGTDLYASTLDEVVHLETELGIAELAGFTPTPPGRS
jgi:hemerythrin-like domain-containing protein